MKDKGKSVADYARDLVSTSVEDLQSSLGNYKWDEQFDVEIVRYGLNICERRGEKTKAALMKRKLKQMEKMIEKDLKAYSEKVRAERQTTQEAENGRQ